jgi:hypothetical protein
MKTQKKIYELSGHGLKRGHRTRINGKRVVITRTKDNTVWYRPETLKEKALRLWDWVRGAR